ncbi:MAG TPA: hypothetical protein VFL60_07675 [Gaiellaceae bacterium]|nr:hypothetical protein [Gaiellaceae bacterium]
MRRWDLTSLPPSTEKEQPRAPGPGAPRAPRRDGRIPRALFSTPECRAVVVELGAGEEMGDHRVRERAVVQVVAGAATISGEECGAGTLVMFEPGERHDVRAHEDTTLLLLLAPWPAPEHYGEHEAADAQHLPPNASVDPA